MASAGRNFYNFLNANFRLDFDDMLEDAVRYSNTRSPYYNSPEQIDTTNNYDTVCRDKRTGYIITSDSRNQLESSSEESEDEEISEEEQIEVPEPPKVIQKRRTPISAADDARDFNDFLDNYERYKKINYYPDVVYGRRKPLKPRRAASPSSLKPRRAEPPNPLKYRRSESPNPLKPRRAESPNPLKPRRAESPNPLKPRRAETPNSLPAKPSTSGSKNVKNNKRNVPSDFERPKVAYGWTNTDATEVDSSRPTSSSTCEEFETPAETPQIGWSDRSSTSGSAIVPIGFSTPMSSPPVGWNYRNQLPLYPDDISIKKGACKARSDASSREYSSTKSQPAPSTFSKLKSRIFSIFRN